MNAFSGKGVTSRWPSKWSCSFVSMYVCLFVCVCVCVCVCVHILSVSDAVVTFSGCGQVGLSVSLSQVVASTFILARASVNPDLTPIFSSIAPTDCVSLRPVLYKCVILFILAQWRLFLPGNTVLNCCSNYTACDLHVSTD